MTSVHDFTAATDRPDAGLERFPGSHPGAAPGLVARLARAKFAYTTRNVRRESLRRILPTSTSPRPRAGDLVLARILEIGQHKRLELANGRRATLFPRDEVVVCFGARYAPDQFEAEIPSHLGPCDLAAAGGVAAEMITRHQAIGSPTRLEPIGLLGDDEGRPSNLADWALGPAHPRGAARPTTYAVVGTAMNAGKTTAAASLVRGLAAAGQRVGAAKVTGTGAGGDLWLMSDAGAHPVLDFTHAGVPSTYRTGGARIAAVLETLTDHLASADLDAIVLEVADGLCQEETAALVASATFAQRVDAVVFAATDAMGAAGGVNALGALGLPVAAVSGVLTASPLAMRETRQLTGMPVLDLEALEDPQRVTEVMSSVGGPNGTGRHPALAA